MTQEQTINDFIVAHKIALTTKPANVNPNMDQDAWHASATHWKCTLHMQGRKLTTTFSQGSAFHAPPTADDVLDCLASNSASVDGETFREWCGTFGADEDSRSAERTYKVCKRQAATLRQFLGSEELYHELLFNTERA